jgi:hypothetical protein
VQDLLPASWRRALGVVLALIAASQMVTALAMAQETVLYSFNAATGTAPMGGVILDRKGNLYGTGLSGGDQNHGVVFEVARHSDGTWSESTLYNFGGAPDGANPGAALVFDSNGHLFGTTLSGGTGEKGPCMLGCGTVFELFRNSTGGGWTEKVLYQFLGGTDGAFPTSKLVFDKLGNLYGTTQQGGMSSLCAPNYILLGCGTVFELSPNSDGSWSENVLYRFQGGLDGLFPSGVIFDGAANLFGTSEGGLSCDEYLTGASCGAIFQLHRTSTGWVKSAPYRFKGGTGGFFPKGKLSVSSSGTLYGTTDYGGVGAPPYGYGTVFQLTRRPSGGWNETVLYSFVGLLDGCNATEGVTLDPAGNLYGEATNCGGSTLGSAPGGTVFKLAPISGGWAETTLATFQSPNIGQQPYGGVVLDLNGNLYGGLSLGGSNACGALFELTP